MSKVPRHFTAMLQALRLCDPQPEALQTLTSSEWNDLLSRAEYARLMIPLGQVCAEELPRWVLSRVARNVSDNSQRFERIKADYLAIAEALRRAHVEHLILKGFALCPDFVEHPRFRMQSDIDIFCPPESIRRACNAVSALGYEPNAASDYMLGHHLPAFSRKSNWKWRGNLFDPEMPVSLELHFQFSDEILVHLGTKGLERFWDHRIEQSFDDLRFPALRLVDHFGYCALHVVRHLTGGMVPIYNVYELARFLHRTAYDEAFWNDWRQSHDDSIRPLQAICCYLAHDWFACRLPGEMQQAIHELPNKVRTWLRMYSGSPLAAWLRPNKDTLWLHAAVLQSWRDKRSVLFTTLVPTRIPHYVAANFSQPAIGEDGQASRPGSLGSRADYLSHVISRTAYHLSIFLPTLWRGLRFWWATTELGAQFWIYFAAFFFFDFGMFIFFFLFNLFLLDCGYREDFLGLVTSVSAVGAIIGTIAGGIVTQRLGLRKTLLFCFSCVPMLSACRLLLVSKFPQLSLAFLVSVVGTMSAVCYSPALAQVTNLRNRAFAFSLVASTLIGIGALAGLTGGTLPGWIGWFAPSATPLYLKQISLLIASAIMAIALWPSYHFRFAGASAPEKRLYPRNPFLRRFLPAIGVWALVTGSFSPFFNVYFSKHLGMPVKQIGIVFSFSSVSQVIAILATPVIFRQFGLVPGLMYMQIATAISLGLLAAAPGARSGAVVYTGFMAFQWMSEPGMDTLLMNEMSPSERSGASALSLLVISSAQAVAAVVAGASFARFGYPAVLTATAGVALVAAVLFRVLLGKSSASTHPSYGQTYERDRVAANRAESTI